MSNYNPPSTAHLTLNTNTRAVKPGVPQTARPPLGLHDNEAHYIISSAVIKPYLTTPSCKQFNQDTRNNRKHEEKQEYCS